MFPEVFIQKREALFEKPIERLDKQRVCEACGKVLADGEDILCMSCLNESRSYKCLGCGNTFDFPNYLRYIKRLNIPKYCVTCSSTVMLKCASCDSEVETPKYIADEYELKKRKFYCPSCSKFVKVRCECCKNEFEIQTYRINEIKQDNKQKSLYCNDCWKLVTVECCGCHEPFKTFVWKKKSILSQNKNFYCSKCREKWR